MELEPTSISNKRLSANHYFSQPCLTNGKLDLWAGLIINSLHMVICDHLYVTKHIAR